MHSESRKFVEEAHVFPGQILVVCVGAPSSRFLCQCVVMNGSKDPKEKAERPSLVGNGAVRLVSWCLRVSISSQDWTARLEIACRADSRVGSVIPGVEKRCRPGGRN